jgi:UPF0755 protein
LGENSTARAKLKMKKIFIVLAMLLMAVAAFAIFFEFSTPKQRQKDTITILRGENSLQIAGDLKAEGYINSKIFFVLELLKGGNFKNLKSGEYDFKDIGQTEMIYKLVHADTAVKTVTIVPGQTLADIAAVLRQKDIADANEFLAASSTLNFKNKYDFLADLPDNAAIEGYFFPDTYQLPQNPTANDVAGLALDNFGKKLTSPLRQEIKKRGKTIFETIIMASILEKEVITLEDKKIVAGILQKRINEKMPLQVDCAILYDNNGKFDKEIDSPYNTYKYGGLPAGPICNPGMESIEAAIEPAETQYWYYLSAPDGTTIFSKNYDEHLANVAKYLKK